MSNPQNYDSVPQELKDLRQWVCWRRELRGKKKDGTDNWTKLPFQTSGSLASTTDPKTWNTFQACVDAEAETKQRFDGIGFVFTKDSGLVGIDFDHCRDPKTAEIEQWAATEISELDSWTEVSPSGTGLHTVVKGTKPSVECRKGRVEMYSAGRYFTVTGSWEFGTGGMSIEPRDLTVLHKKMLNGLDPKTLEVKPVDVDDSSEDFKLIGSLSAKLCITDPEKLEQAVASAYPERYAQRNREKGNRVGKTYFRYTIENFLKKQVTPLEPQDEPWPEPKPIDTSLPAVASFDIKFLPNCFRSLAVDVSERMSVPLDFTAIPLIVGLAGAVGRRAFVHPKHLDKEWKETGNLWGGVIASSGKIKTPTFSAILKPHRNVETEWLRQYDERLLKFHRDMEAWDATPLPQRTGNPPQKPVAKRLVVNDATPERLHQTMSENPAGLFVVRDELSGWVAELDKEGREAQRELFLTGWNGNENYAIERIGRGLVSAVMCLSMFGGFQPVPLQDFLKEKRNISDGTFQRFSSLVWPDSLPYQNVDRLPNYAAIASVEKIIKFLAGLPEEKLHFHFDTNAQPVFDQWMVEHQHKVEREPYPPKQSHLSKYRGLVPKLAMLFQLADIASELVQRTDPDEPVGSHFIDAEHLQQAITLCAYLETHAHRIYSCVKTEFELAVESLTAHILAGGLDDYEKGVTARDIERKHWSGLKDRDLIKDTLDELAEMGWTRWTKPLKNPKGGRPTDHWAINPNLKREQRS